MAGDNTLTGSQIATYVFLDFESTGLLDVRRRPRITELCLLAVHRVDMMEHRSFPRVVNKLTLCLDPQKPISPYASNITGLFNDNLELQKALSADTVHLIDSFLSHLAQPVCLLAHNGNGFDFLLLNSELKRINQSLTSSLLCVDTLEAFRSLDGLSPRHVPLANQIQQTPVKPAAVASSLNNNPPVLKRKSTGESVIPEKVTKVQAQSVFHSTSAEHDHVKKRLYFDEERRPRVQEIVSATPKDQGHMEHKPNSSMISSDAMATTNTAATSAEHDHVKKRLYFDEERRPRVQEIVCSIVPALVSATPKDQGHMEHKPNSFMISSDATATPNTTAVANGDTKSYRTVNGGNLETCCVMEVTTEGLVSATKTFSATNNIREVTAHSVTTADKGVTRVTDPDILVKESGTDVNATNPYESQFSASVNDCEYLAALDKVDLVRETIIDSTDTKQTTDDATDTKPTTIPYESQFSASLEDDDYLKALEDVEKELCMTIADNSDDSERNSSINNVTRPSINSNRGDSITSSSINYTSNSSTNQAANSANNYTTNSSTNSAINYTTNSLANQATNSAIISTTNSSTDNAANSASNYTTNSSTDNATNSAINCSTISATNSAINYTTNTSINIAANSASNYPTNSSTISTANSATNYTTNSSITDSNCSNMNTKPCVSPPNADIGSELTTNSVMNGTGYSIIKQSSMNGASVISSMPCAINSSATPENARTRTSFLLAIPENAKTRTLSPLAIPENAKTRTLSPLAIPENAKTPAGNTVETPGNKKTTPGNARTTPASPSETSSSGIISATPGNARTIPGNEIATPASPLATPSSHPVTLSNCISSTIPTTGRAMSPHIDGNSSPKTTRTSSPLTTVRTSSPAQLTPSSKSMSPNATTSNSVTETPSSTSKATTSNSVTETPSSTSKATPSNSVTKTPSSTSKATPSNSVTKTPSSTSKATPSNSVIKTPSSTTVTPTSIAGTPTKWTSYKLEEIYKRVFKSPPPASHRAEDDCMALVAVVKRTPGFLDWVDRNAVLLTSVEPPY